MFVGMTVTDRDFADTDFGSIVCHCLVTIVELIGGGGGLLLFMAVKVEKAESIGYEIVFYR